MPVHQLTRLDARRIAVRAQLLDKGRPKGLFDVARHLAMLQLDPTDAVAPNADLVVWSRLGSSYATSEMDAALEDQTLLELHQDVEFTKTMTTAVRHEIDDLARWLHLDLVLRD